VTDRQPYTHGPFKLDEIDGVLHYQGVPIVAVAELEQHDPEYSWKGIPSWRARINLPPLSISTGGAEQYESRFYFIGSGWSAVEAALEAAGIVRPYVYPLRRCNVCDGWAAGGGAGVCSDVCRKVYRAGRARERRARARVAATETCVVCGAPLDMQRTSRRFCSNRCRQAEYRKRERENHGGAHPGRSSPT
jgi:predicted nucleic acid-binding Zn ribbon protein